MVSLDDVRAWQPLMPGAMSARFGVEWLTRWAYQDCSQAESTKFWPRPPIRRELGPRARPLAGPKLELYTKSVDFRKVCARRFRVDSAEFLALKQLRPGSVAVSPTHMMSHSYEWEPSVTTPDFTLHV